jgi:(p)ppGpp synthase/HD superfamily hydrolase
MIKSLKECRDYFFHLHDVECNQKYNKTLPYSFHLEMVEAQAKLFENLIPVDEPYYSAVFVGIYGHDSIEDARLTYNDILKEYGELAAEIIYLCTENKGRTRSDRKNDVFYHELKKNDLAVFVKLCDLIANVKFSLLTNSSMLNKYKAEYKQKVKPMLYSEDYKDMFEYLDRLFEVKL